MRPKHKRKRHHLEADDKQPAIIHTSKAQQQSFRKEEILKVLQPNENPRVDDLYIGIRITQVLGAVDEGLGELVYSSFSSGFHLTILVSKFIATNVGKLTEDCR